jgi:hypothetical protein
MKTLLGLFVLSLSFSTFAKTSQLLLRASVPSVIEMKLNDKGEPEFHSNGHRKNLPKIIISKNKNFHLIAIFHP